MYWLIYILSTTAYKRAKLRIAIQMVYFIKRYEERIVIEALFIPTLSVMKMESQFSANIVSLGWWGVQIDKLFQLIISSESISHASYMYFILLYQQNGYFSVLNLFFTLSHFPLLCGWTTMFGGAPCLFPTFPES